MADDTRDLGTNALERMAWDRLIALRAGSSDPDIQRRIAPYEHRAYAREEVASNPLSALGFAIGVPGYQVLKLLGQGARTRPSWEQMRQGYIGIGEGLAQALRGRGA